MTKPVKQKSLIKIRVAAVKCQIRLIRHKLELFTNVNCDKNGKIRLTR